ncbi:hypothetical protein HYH03_004131 [Edaphochlamys debaryana]|uniref:Patatin n=1 Tax=Edaphochlamys debaryana TaxID=47281 RepID=A0A835Y7T7_9CHLO|nr:hypothetical protein HYH03_004131 [Edaphochlamys debaryana]|eukprot:KAG2497865.1 hypothetical protein HYH03_004131 [Edaphochlamys debaryana]
MFSRRVFGGQPDSFKLVLEYGRDSPEQQQGVHAAAVRLPIALATVEFEFNSDEAEDAVLARFTQAKSRVAFDRLEERVVLKLKPRASPLAGVSAKLSVAALSPALRCLQVVRTSSTGNAPEALLTALLKHCDLAGVWKLRGADGFGNFWCSCCEVRSWRSLANLNLSACGLASLPAAVGSLAPLRILRLSHNRLTSLPPELSALSVLEVLAADHNQLTALPAELRRCSSLRHLELENNRLAAPVLDLRALSNLVSLQLYGNPLEYLPELSPASALRSLSLANVRIMADAPYTRWEVEVAATSWSRGHKLAPLFQLTFRRSSCQHPLLAGALGRISEDRASCELIAREETAIAQLVLMALSEQPVVAEQACRTLGALAGLGLATARKLLAHDVLSTVTTLLRSPRPASKLCGLQLLSSLAANAEAAVSAELLTPEVLGLLHACVQGPGRGSAQGAATAVVASLTAPGPPGTPAVAPPNFNRPSAGAATSTAAATAAASSSSGGARSQPSSAAAPAALSIAGSAADSVAVQVAALTALANLAFSRDNKLKIRAAEGLLGLLVELATTPTAPPPGLEAADGSAWAGADGLGTAGVSGGGASAGGAMGQAAGAVGGLRSLSPPGTARAAAAAAVGGPVRGASPPRPGATTPNGISGGGGGPAAAAAGSRPTSTPSGPTPPASMTLPLRAAGERYSDTGAGAGGGGGGAAAFAAMVGSPPGPGPHFTHHSFSGTPSSGGQLLIASAAGAANAPAASSAAAAAGQRRPSQSSRPVLHYSASASAHSGGGAPSGGGAAATAAAAAGRTLSPGRSTGVWSPTSPAAGSAVAEGGGAGPASAAGGLPPQIALAPPRPVPQAAALRDQPRLLAIKVLAILGENEQVARAVGVPPIGPRRGLRVLALDGGGMRGLALVTIMRHIERRTGRPLHTLFDLVVGTSTGAIVAVGLGVFHFSLDQCESIYTGLGHKVFNQAAAVPGAPTPREELMAAAQAQAAAAAGGTSATAAASAGGWRDSLFRVVKGTSTNLRVAVYGFKHDASTFEELLKQMCDIRKLGCTSNQLIDAAALGGPKVAAVATLVSLCPVTPFLFTTYELPPESEAAAAAMRCLPASSRHLIWQAVRASSAAPYYLDDFVCGEDRYQDGAATANNPAILALQQARLLWPGARLEALVSIGCGAAPTVRRERGAHAVLDTGAVLVDAATSPDRADEALSTLLPLVPGARYFRFQPVHERCAMELDDVNPSHWAALQAAVDEYCVAHSARMDELADLLTSGLDEPDADLDELEGLDEHGQHAAEEDPFEGPQGLGPDGAPLPRVPRIRLGNKRGLVLVEAPCLPAGCATVPAAVAAAAAASGRELPDPSSAAAALSGCVGRLVVEAELSDFLASHPQCVRRCDLAATADDAALSASLVAAHTRWLEEEQRRQDEAAEQQRRAIEAEARQEPADDVAIDDVDDDADAASDVSAPHDAGQPQPQPQQDEGKQAAGTQGREAQQSGGGGGPVVGAAEEVAAQSLPDSVARSSASEIVGPRTAGGAGSSSALAALVSPRSSSFRTWSATPGRNASGGGAGAGGGAAEGGVVSAAAAAAAAGASGVADAAVEAAAVAAASPPPASLFDYFFGSSTTARQGTAAGSKPPGGTVTAAAAPPATATSASAGPVRTLVAEAMENREPSLGPPSPRAAAAAAAAEAAAPLALHRPSSLLSASFSLPVRSPSSSTGGGTPSASPAPGNAAAPREPPLPPGPSTTPPSASGPAAGTDNRNPKPNGTNPNAPAQTANTTSGSGTRAGAGADADGDVPPVFPAMLLGALLQDLGERAGLLHLGLTVVPEGEAGAEGGALVASWRREVEAVVEPGPDADRVLRELGLQPGPSAPSLSALFAATRGAPLEAASGCRAFRLLARTEVWHAGQPLVTLLLQAWRPATLLRPSDLSPLGPQLSGLVLTTSAPLPPALVGALLRAGARAVLAPSAPATALRPAALSLRSSGGSRESISFGGAALPPPLPPSSVSTHPSGMAAGVKRGSGAGGGEAEGRGGDGLGPFLRAVVDALAEGETVFGALGAAEGRYAELRGCVTFHHM